MKVAFFPGCMVDMLYPEVGIAAVNVLEKLPDDQVCCGQPFSNSGYIEEAKPMMKKVIDAYSGYDTIVSLTGSCAWAIKAEYPHFFADDVEYSNKIADLAPRNGCGSCLAASGEGRSCRRGMWYVLNA